MREIIVSEIAENTYNISRYLPDLVSNSVLFSSLVVVLTFLFIWSVSRGISPTSGKRSCDINTR
jgi:hypothetical protein